MSVIGKGDEEGLRHVEKDVLIPKKMKAKAMKLCEKHVKGTKRDFDVFGRKPAKKNLAVCRKIKLC